MIERIFIDNVHCFVNFEWKPGKVALFMGENGSGKSALGRVLWGIRALVADEVDVRTCFPSKLRTRWESRWDQRIELDVRLGEDLYHYELVVSQDPDQVNPARVRKEFLLIEQSMLMSFENGLIQLFDDDGQSTAPFPTHQNRSGLATIAENKRYKQLSAFKRWLVEDLWFFRPNPRAIHGRTDEGVKALHPNLENFAPWYAKVITQDLHAAFKIQSSLTQLLPGFETLSVDRQRPQLQARFTAGPKTSYTVDFEELSDGQRMLIALYVLRHVVVKPGRLLFFDEPDNYVALREIQPWLTEVIDEALTSEGPQVWFISHHPEVLNQLAPSHGTRFFRHEGGPVRVEPFHGAPGLTAAETVARGVDS